ncbi:HAMP domain-containing sensor histidine kinase [uncultured Algimonas sp.]|uniref:sensor histidine kinase n=1 Tax=uncultured Algimonas sp. TaxID=1547920 RepID=UPI00261FF767|nr:HAMP domain-containing sensor histidine kinase [uncultured Algimonas sp.]
MRRNGLPMARLLTRRLAWIALAVLLANLVLIWAYYGSDPETLQDHVVETRMSDMEAALTGSSAPDYRIGDDARDLFEAHPGAYGFVLAGPDGTPLDAMNAELVPPAALTSGRFADDWIVRDPQDKPPRLLASHAVGPADAGLRLVFAARGDPANLLGRAVVEEFVSHIAVPLIPAILLLLGINALMVHRSLMPVGRAADWARRLRPGARRTSSPPETGLREIDDLLDATRRALDSLTAALSSETRRAAEAAHALRTPLAALVARLDDLPDGEASRALRKDMAQLSRTVRQILDSAKADMIAIEPDSHVDLKAVAMSVVSALAPVAIRSGAELELDQDRSVPGIRGNRDAVILALTNLVENAIIHAGGRITVKVGPGPQLSVHDRGPGLPNGDPGILFEAFRQGPDAPATGAGLGLSIAQRVQRAHDGRLAARNHPDGGAEFSLIYGEN